jgi:CIC family chloride channel protein
MTHSPVECQHVVGIYNQIRREKNMEGIPRSWTRRLEQNEERVFLLLTLLIGGVVGLVVVAFIVLTGNLGARLYPPGGSPWRRLLVPVAGSLITGYLLSRYFPFARGSGIPQTKAALFAREGYIGMRTVLGKFFCCSMSLASGIALGREGPSVQVGAGIASVLGRSLGLGPERVKALIPVGASAAVAAAFNTPIAGVLFALEEIMGDMNAPVLGSVVLSSATAWIVLHLLLGDEPLFHVPAYELVHGVEFAVYAVLGVFGGVVSAGFVKLLLGLRAWFLRRPGRTQWLQPTVGGVVVGVMGWFVPQSLGIGYQYVGDALNGSMALKAMALLLGLRVVGTAICYASGNAGGIFGPALFIGAMLGGALGSIAHTTFPNSVAPAGAYALVGMGAAFAGIVRVPMTSVIMIFEVTRDYAIIVPLMISNLISFFISRRLQPEAIYEALARQDGVHLPSAGSRAARSTRRVAEAMSSPATLLAPETTIQEALDRMRSLAVGAWPVAGGRQLLGLVTASDLEGAANGGAGRKPVSEVLEPLPDGHLDAIRFPHVHPDHPLDLALQRMGEMRLDVLPVVSRANVLEILGIITLADALRAYGIRSK